MLPLLNGVADLDRLEAEFGSGPVPGGLSNAAVALTPERVARQFTKLQHLQFGELDGRLSPRVGTIAAAFELHEAAYLNAKAYKARGAGWLPPLGG